MATSFYTREDIRPSRQRAGLSQRGLARLAGVSQSRISGLESDRVPAQIAAALDRALNQKEA